MVSSFVKWVSIINTSNGCVCLKVARSLLKYRVLPMHYACVPCVYNHRENHMLHLGNVVGWLAWLGGWVSGLVRERVEPNYRSSSC